jgi:hypothetical protein
METHEDSTTPSLPLADQPDPSFLTTEALKREVGYLRTLLEAQVENAQELAKTLRISDEKFESERDRRITEVKLESDRRLTEVAAEREKALKIKEEADRDALVLDREIRQFKDEKASARMDAAVGTLEQRLQQTERYQASTQGSQAQRQLTFGQIVALVTVLLFTVSILVTVLVTTHGFTK